MSAPLVPEYRRGRLVIPADINARHPDDVASWLSAVPADDQANAFRAMPLATATEAYLAMSATVRFGFLMALNPANIDYLCAVCSDAHLLETLRMGSGEQRVRIFQTLPAARRQPLEATLAEEETQTVTVGTESNSLSWWRRKVRSRLRHRPSQSSV